MKKIYYISDFFSNEVNGGAEKADDAIISALSKHYEIKKIRSSEFDNFREYHKDDIFIVSNFVNLKNECKNTIQRNRYFIIEHDHKYIKTRNPTFYKDNVVPAGQLYHTSFYRNAEYVFAQSKAHAECIRDNLLLDNVCNFGMSFWTQEELDHISFCLQNDKNDDVLVLRHRNPLKGTYDSIRFCDKKGIKPKILPGTQDYFDFIDSMSRAKSIVYLPRLMESFCRLIAEARMLELKVYSSKNVSCILEDWFSKYKGQELIDFVRQKMNSNLKSIIDTIETGKSDLLVDPCEYPKVSLITSMFKGEKYIEKFLNNITSQTVFKYCELLIIDAASPENEYPIIEKYMKKYPNIVYTRLEEDPGIYGVWNIGAKMATGKYLTNTNLDDIRSEDQIEIMVNCLEKNPDIDLVYSESYVTNVGNETYHNNSSGGKTYPITDFSHEAMIKCLPGCMPVWRKTMHDKAGYFDESFRYAGDHEMWLRAVRNGSDFKRVSGVHGLYYMNPDGLSTSEANAVKRYKEEQRVFWEYIDIFGYNVTEQYSEYFSRL